MADLKKYRAGVNIKKEIGKKKKKKIDTMN